MRTTRTRTTKTMRTMRTTKTTKTTKTTRTMPGRSADPTSRDYRRGAIAAAEVADIYNASTMHDHRLGDCILAKLNLRRRNRQRIDAPEEAWVRGFAAGLVLMHGRLLHGADAEGVRAAARSANLGLVDFRRASVTASDLRALRRAGISP